MLIDELHAQRTRQLWDTLRYAGASRRQPLLLSVTTAGFDRHSICWEQHDNAEKVLDGTIEDTALLAFIAAAAPEDDWTAPAVWQRANPSFGVTIGAEQFAEDCREAQESPARENSFRRYRLNQWTEQAVRWLSMEKWDACGTPAGDLRERACYAGLDLSSTTDLSVLVLVFPEEDRYRVLPFFWVPEEGARRRERRDRVPYTAWVREGYIEATPGEVIDYDRIRRRINELGRQYEIREIAIDRWMAGNVSIEKDAADNWKPSKKKSIERIDGIVALIMALDRASTQPPAETSVYDTRGILSV